MNSDLMAEDDAASLRKLSHNANERDRRKKLNALYSQLQLLLPNTNPEGQRNNPSIVCEALNYIPQLHNQIKELQKQRDELLTTQRISESSMLSVVGTECQTSSPIITVNPAFGRSDQLAITIHTCNVGGLLFSALLFLVEQEGLDVLNASKLVAGENVSYSLHLQMTGRTGDLDNAFLCNKILLLWSCRKRDDSERP